MRCPTPHLLTPPLTPPTPQVVPALDPEALGFRALFAPGLNKPAGPIFLKAMACRSHGVMGPQREILEGGLAVAAAPGLVRWCTDQSNRLRNVLKSLRMPSPPPDYDEAHSYLVEEGKRSADSVECSMAVGPLSCTVARALLCHLCNPIPHVATINASAAGRDGGCTS